MGKVVQEPSAAWRQEWQTPLATSLTRTSPSPGSSRSTSCTRIGPPRSSTSAARIRRIAPSLFRVPLNEGPGDDVPGAEPPCPLPVVGTLSGTAV